MLGLRSNIDHLKLEPKLGYNLVKSETMFCFAALEELIKPLSVKHSDTVLQFKLCLKQGQNNV